MFCLWHSHRFMARLFRMIFFICRNRLEFHFQIFMSELSFWSHQSFHCFKVISVTVYTKWITFSLSLSSFRRYFDRYKERFFNGWCSKWSAADDIRDIVHGVCTDLRLPGRSVFATMDHDLRRITVEWHNADRLIHAVVSIVHSIPGVSRCRRGIVQYYCADHHIGFVCQRHSFENVGHVLLCYTSWFGFGVSFYQIAFNIQAEFKFHKWQTVRCYVCAVRNDVK